MTRARLALLLSPALPLAPLLLALASCGGESESRSSDRKGGVPPLGFELAAASTGDAAASRVVDVTPEALWQQIEAGEVRVIDVRTREEALTGILPDAEHIALDSFDPAKLDLSDGRKVVLYCRTGRRSAEAAERLAAFTGRPVEHLAGGIAAWEALALPIDKPEELILAGQ